MPKIVSKEEFIKKFNESKYPELTVDISTFTFFTKKCKFIDSEYGEWWAIPKNIVNKRCKHPKRAIIEQTNNRRFSIEAVKEKIFNKWDTLVVLDEQTYININKTCRFIDSEYGEFFTSPAHVIDGSGHTKRGHKKASKSLILSIEELKKRIFDKHGDKITIKDDTYESLYKKALFIHKEYGEWWATPNNVISHSSSHPSGWLEKSKATCIEKYGVDSPLKNKEIFIKVQKNLWNTVKVKHWKTNKDVICRGSYEFAVINKLNELKIDYKTQIQFTLDNNVVYFCDLYLVSEDKYIEIKGIFWNEKNLNKWNEFHSKYKNSDIWYTNEVKIFTNKSVYMMKKEFDIYKDIKSNI